MLYAPATIMFPIFIPIQFVLSWLGGVPFENGLVSRVSWRLASEIVAGENRLMKFLNAMFASRTLHGLKKCITSAFLGRKTEQQSMCIGDCIDSVRDRFTTKVIL